MDYILKSNENKNMKARGFEIAKGFEKAADKALEVLDDISMEASKENLIKVAKTSMSGKGSFSNLDVMAEQLVNALLDVEEKGKIDADMIKIRKIHGAAAETTEISECVTVDKNVVESEMPKDVKNAKI